MSRLKLMIHNKQVMIRLHIRACMTLRAVNNAKWVVECCIGLDYMEIIEGCLCGYCCYGVCAFLRTKLNMWIVSEMRVNISDCPSLFIMVGVLSEAYTCFSESSQVF